MRQQRQSDPLQGSKSLHFAQKGTHNMCFFEVLGVISVTNSVYFIVEIWSGRSMGFCHDSIHMDAMAMFDAMRRIIASPLQFLGTDAA